MQSMKRTQKSTTMLKRGSTEEFSEYARRKTIVEEDRQEPNQRTIILTSPSNCQFQPAFTQKDPVKTVILSSQLSYVKKSLPNQLTISDVTLAGTQSSPWWSTPIKNHKVSQNSLQQVPTETMITQSLQKFDQADSPILMKAPISSQQSQQLISSHQSQQLLTARKQSEKRTNSQESLKNISNIIEHSRYNLTLPSSSSKVIDQEHSAREFVISPHKVKGLNEDKPLRIQLKNAKLSQGFKVISKLALDQFYSDLDLQKKSIYFTTNEIPVSSKIIIQPENSDRRVTSRISRNMKQKFFSTGNFSILETGNILSSHENVKKKEASLTREEQSFEQMLLYQHNVKDIYPSEQTRIISQSWLKSDNKSKSKEPQVKFVKHSPISLFIKRSQNFNEEFKEKLQQGLVNPKLLRELNRVNNTKRKVNLINNIRATRSSLSPRPDLTAQESTRNPQYQHSTELSLSNILKRRSPSTSSCNRTNTQTPAVTMTRFSDKVSGGMSARGNSYIEPHSKQHSRNEISPYNRTVQSQQNSCFDEGPRASPQKKHNARKSTTMAVTQTATDSFQFTKPYHDSSFLVDCSEISDYFSEIRDRIESVIKKDQLFLQMIQYKLLMNLEQFLYLLSFFWRVCLMHRQNSSASQGTSFFVIEEEYLKRIEDVMLAILNEKVVSQQTSREKVTQFMITFREQSTLLILPKNIIEHIGGERSVRRLLSSFISRLQAEVFTGDRFESLVNDLDVDACVQIVCGFLLENGNGHQNSISAAREALNITSAEFFFSKRVLLEVVSADPHIKPIYRMKIIERFERLRSELLQDLTVKQLSQDHKVTSMFLVSMRSAKLMSRENTFDMGAYLSSMLFGSITLAQFSLKVSQELKCIELFGETSVYNSLSRIVQEVIGKVASHFKDSTTLVKHCKIRFQILKETLQTSRLRGVKVFTRGDEIASDLQHWVVHNFDSYPRHIQMTSDDNTSLEFMRFFVTLYFYREADVFSYLDVPSAMKFLPYTETAAAFWVHGLFYVLSEEKYSVNSEAIEMIIYDICDFLDLGETERNFPQIQHETKQISQRSEPHRSSIRK